MNGFKKTEKVEYAVTGTSTAAFSGSGNKLYSLVLLCIMAFVTVCRLRLLYVPFERDEGEYAYAGQELLKGIPPFASTHHVKMPGVYGMDAIFIALFGHSIQAVHLGLLLCNLVSIVFCYTIAKKLFNPLAGLFAAMCFALLTLSSSTLGFTANAEHFVLLFVLPGLLLLLRAMDEFMTMPKRQVSVRLFFSGLLLGIAFTMKQHAVYFIAVAVLYYIYKTIIGGQAGKKRFLVNSILFAAGGCTPVLVLCLYFLQHHLFDTFWWWTFYYPRIYVSQVSMHNCMINLKCSGRLFVKENWPILSLASAGFVSIIIEKGKYTFFLLTLLAASLAMVAAGLNFFGHYYLNAAPAIALMTGAAIHSIDEQMKTGSTGFLKRRRLILLLPIFLSAMAFKDRRYYFKDDEQTILGNAYGINIFPDCVAIGNYLKQHTLPTDKIAVMGSEPEIYFYADRSAATGYIYTYEMMRDHPFVYKFQKQMSDEIEAAKPAYIVVVRVSASWYAGMYAKSEKYIFNWQNEYINKFYEPVGLLNVPGIAPSTLEFDRPDKKYVAKTVRYVLVFKRKG